MIDNRDFTRPNNFNNNNNLNNTGLQHTNFNNNNLNNTNNNNLNNSNINFYDEAQLAAQLDLLKEKLKMKDAEFEFLLNNQKQEYEKAIRERDEEVTGIVDHLLSENQELKRQILDLEIELEQCKEKMAEYKKNYEMHYGQDLFPSDKLFSNNLNKTENLNLNLSILKKSQQVINVNNLTNNNLTQNQNANLSAFLPKSGDNNYFMETVKLMKSNNDLKQKEINDKYNLLIQNMIYDNKVTVENLKRINIENKNRILQDRNALDSLIPIKYLEDQVNLYENKIKTLYEELKSKEKYISISENKFEMLNEENNFIKTRLAEERKFLLMKIAEIKKEHEETHGKVIKQIQLDIAEKKQNLQAKVEESLKVNEDVIKNLIREKEKIVEENNFLKKKVETLNSEIEEIIGLKKRSDDNITKIEDEIRTVLHNKKIWSEEQAKFNIEKNTIIKANEEMQKQINEFKLKIAALENQIKLNAESEEAKARDMDKTLREYDARYKSQIEKLNTQIIDLERKLKQYSFDFEGEENKIFLLEKKIKEDRISYENTLLENESLKVQLNDAKVNVKLLNQSLDEKEKVLEKLRASNAALDIGNVKKDESIKMLNERVTVLESEKHSNEDEIQRLMRIKSDLVTENDEVKKARLFLSTQLDTLKMSNNIEVQRLRSQIYELEKMTEKIHLVQFLENSNNNLKKDLADLKIIIQRIHNQYLKPNENEVSNANQSLSPLRKLEELKQLEEIEDFISKALKHDHSNHNTHLPYQSKAPIILKTNPNLSENVKDSQKDFKSYSLELESQINLLKKKLLISENNLKNAALENQNFTRLHDENRPSLYETILIYIKNLNIQHLLETYNLHLHKEEEFSKVLKTQKSPSANEFANKIKNLSEKLFHLTKHCELAFNDYENRSKAYISIEEFERRLGEYKYFIEQNLNNFLSLLVANMVNNNEFVVFRLNHKEYNQALENISSNLEHYNKLNYDAIEAYKGNFYALQSALEIIQKQAKIEYDNVRSIINEENFKFF